MEKFIECADVDDSKGDMTKQIIAYNAVLMGLEMDEDGGDPFKYMD